MIIKIPYVFLVAVFLLIISCSKPNGEQKTISHDTLIIDKSISKTGADTFFVNEPSILFMWPDSIQAEKMKSKDSDAFYTAADDYSFYNSQLMDLTDSMKIVSYNTNAKFLDFHFASDKHLIIDRSASENLWWGLYLFNGSDAPKLHNTVDIDPDYIRNFFKQ